MKTLIVGFAVLAALALDMPLTAFAATITVNTTADNTMAGDGQCTLREAIANVNAAADTTSGDCAAGTGAGDTINFNLTPRSIISLKRALGELTIGQNVSITGPAIGSLRIKGHGRRMFEITAGGTNMSNLTIQGGRAIFSVGGGILVDSEASLTLTNCTLSGNRSTTGGAIYNDGTATLTNCTLIRNRAYGAGGGIYNGGTATLTNCTLSRNKAYGPGAGISNAGTATLTNCTLSRNRAYRPGGGISNGGAGTATLTNCTFSGNSSSWGMGGAILTNGGTATLTNTIVANSGLGGNCGGSSITSNGHNLSSDGTCFTTGGTDLLNTDPRLGPLAKYGGPTQTLALCTAVHMPTRSCSGPSPAIDGGDDSLLGPPYNLTTDQRGLPRQAGAHVDIGAYEAQ